VISSPPVPPNRRWPTLYLPDWLLPKTEELARLGEAHPDVQFFRELLRGGRVEETTMEQLTSFIVTAETVEAAQMAIDLSKECILAVGVVAESLDTIPAPHTLHCGRDSLTDAFPQPCRSRNEALKIAELILKSPTCPDDVWLRIDGPDGSSWDTSAIKEELKTRDDMLVLAIQRTHQ
jgi:hypothetical protein